MSKHTPGPWHVAPLESDPYENIQVKAGRNRGICELWQDDAPVPDYNAEQRANARLIAAAPDLLEAAQKALDGCVDLIATAEGNALQAAITKALGGS